ncbi:glycosyltransferase [Kandleria vitulina]|uniref:glycosyltransferase n=1 Tax=Kandleria vitulina TaxID=1630 RepID=UPI00048E8985|nr:glycosyltransferase [Kandleria vitulina]
MIKLMHFIHGFNTGGAETLVKNYMTHIDHSVFDVTVLCIEHFPDSPYEDYLKRQGIKVIYLCDNIKHFDSRRLDHRILNHIEIYLQARKLIREISPDIIHFHLALQNYIRFAKPKKNTIMFYTQHFDFSRMIEDRIQMRHLKWVISHYPTEIIALHSQMKKEMSHLISPQYIEVLNNGIDIDQYQNLSSKVEKRKALHIDENALLIVHVGRFDKIKNHDFLLDVFNDIKKKRPSASLLLIGSGTEEKAILDKVKRLHLEDDVHILSNRDDVNECLQMADGALFPSFSEGMPISLVEMQAAGIPIVASDVISEEIKVSNLITFLPLGNTAQWADTLIDHIERREEVIYDHLEDWDIKESVRKLERLYLERYETWNHE